MPEACLTTEQIERRLTERLAAVRRETRLFTLLVVTGTPAAVVASALVLFGLGRWVGLPLGVLAARHSRGIDLLATIALSLLLASPLVRCVAGRVRSPRARTRCFLALGVYVGTVATTFGTSLSAERPLAFWIGFLLATLVALALVGDAYRPKTSYYLGWEAGGGRLFDDPLSLRDDLDRQHIVLGFATAIPAALLHAYGEALSDSWLWRGLSERETRAAANVVRALVSGSDDAARRTLRTITEREVERVMRSLQRLRWIGSTQRGLGLTAEGVEALGLDPMMSA